MASIETTLKLVDRMSRPLQRIANATAAANANLERFQRLSKSTNLAKGFENVATSVLKVQRNMSVLSGAQTQVASKQRQITSETQRTTSATESWLGSIKGVVATYLGLQTVGAGISIGDEAIQTKARIDNMNDGLQTTAELQQSIYESAQRSRGSYISLQQAVAKIGLLAEDAFSSSSEVVAFTELVQKSFGVGGASTQEQDAGLYQLTQALAAGKLQGDEFRSITENAPLIADAIAKFTGVSKGELKDLSSDGVITADIIRNALFYAADDIETKFQNIPNTFGTVFTQIKNFALNTFQPVIEYLNNALNTETGLRAIENIKTTIAGLAPILTSIINGVVLFADIFNAVFPYLPAVIGTAVLALGAYYAITKQQLIIDTATAIKKAIITGLTFAQTVATVGLTAAWKGLNTVMKANVIIVIVGLIISLVLWIINLAKENDKFATFFVRVWHGILNFFDQIPVFFYTLIDAMIEPFKLWAKTIGKLYDFVINGIIDGINKVLTLVNKLTGSSYEISTKFNFEDIANGFDSFIGDKKASAEARALANKLDRENQLSNFQASREAKRLAQGGIDQYGSESNSGLYGADGELGNIGKVKEVGKIKDKVDISSEDLKTMRELAEMNSIQNFVTLQPSVSFGDTNIRQDGRSIDEIISNIATAIDEQFNASARKVFT